LEKLSELKIAAFCDRLRARDVFDVDFFFTHYPETVSDDGLVAVFDKIQEVGMGGLSHIMLDDEIIRDYDIDGIVLNLADRVAGLMARHAL
jgi:hypothetical protein